MSRWRFKASLDAAEITQSSKTRVHDADSKAYSCIWYCTHLIQGGYQWFGLPCHPGHQTPSRSFLANPCCQPKRPNALKQNQAAGQVVQRAKKATRKIRLRPTLSASTFLFIHAHYRHVAAACCPCSMFQTLQTQFRMRVDLPYLERFVDP